MVTIENDFIKKLEAFLDTEFSPVCKRKIETLLKEYKSNVPSVFIKPQKELKVSDVIVGRSNIVNSSEFIDNVIKEGCNFFGIEEKALLSKNRKQGLVSKRHMIATYLVDIKKCKLIDVGRRFKRDHTTIINSNEVVSDLCETNPLFRENYYNLINHLNKVPCTMN
jgi:hypothetical protein